MILEHSLALSSLRERTREIRTRLEDRLEISTAARSPQAYIAFLSRCYGFLLPLERALEESAPWEALAIEYPGRGKCRLLEQDLHALRVDVSGIAHASTVPDVSTEAGALGALYLIESLSLIGNILAPLVAIHLSRHDVLSVAFFTGYGSRTAAMWQSLGSALERAVNLRLVTLDELFTAAVGAYRSFDSWLEHGCGD